MDNLLLLLTQSFDEMKVYSWEELISNYFFYFSLIFLVFEFIRLQIKKEFNKNIFLDSLTNFVTLFAFISINLLLAGFLIYLYYYVYEYLALTQLPINISAIILCIIMADFIYYWEHRFMHRVNFAWATHTVHHSSPYFNISVAYRFGPLDGFIPIFFHLPLVFLGFNPLVILFAEMFVQLFQTALHTEAIGKFPRFIEAIFNTPSHHRVHHGSNKQYIDKNYAGIFIIWDKMFGTFEEEKEKVVYGVVPQINSVNPIKVFFHGFTRLFSKIKQEKGFKNKILYIFKAPA